MEIFIIKMGDLLGITAGNQQAKSNVSFGFTPVIKPSRFSPLWISKLSHPAYQPLQVMFA
jgi:hypothetical protein